MVTASCAIQIESPTACPPEVVIENPGDTGSDDIDRAGNGESSDRQPAGVGLEHDDPEGVRSRRKDEDVSAGIVPCEILSGSKTSPQDLGMGAFQVLPRGAIADDHLRSREVEAEKGLEVLFVGDPPDRDEDGTGEAEEISIPGPEELGIDTPNPLHEMIEPVEFQLFLHACGRHQGAARAAMEPALQPVRETCMNAGVDLEVVGESGMEGGRERQPASAAVEAGCDSEGPFGRNVDRIWSRILEQASNFAPWPDGEPDLRVAGAWDGAEEIG
jgi:hypothetical protein